MSGTPSGREPEKTAQRVRHKPNDRLFCTLCGIDIIGCGSVYCGEGWRAKMRAEASGAR